ncbi:DUF6702 family protein [Salinimicrobium gaetbulicola]|uniref:DUF6702 family protein n=1 Tax=Salinimicrobium gaetbulicola TaxID=999702 RepID=A0ABW3IE46_9FLAO
MRKTLLLFIALLPLLSFTAAHKFYVSATDIEYNEKNRSLQIISHVFIDDLEKLLKERYHPDLFLLKKGEHPKSDEFIERYFNDKFKIRVNGKEVELNYLGKEYDKDELLIYIEVTDVEPIQNIFVKNAVLTDIFPEQKNVIKVEYKGTIKSLLLTRSEVDGILKFSN